MRATGLYATVALAALASPALAQTPPASDAVPAASAPAGRTTPYDAAFFAPFAPRTALDIARRVPGFQLDLGNTDLRGFAGAAGNVVINGSRPSSKAESLETTLGRIPASRVTRVEVGPGDLFGAEYSSKSQVLNVILSAEAGVDGTATMSLRRLSTGRVVPNGSATALIKRGPSSISLSGGAGYNIQDEEGTDSLTDTVTGAPVEFRRKFNAYEDLNPNASASWALEHAQDRSIHVNARWAAGMFDLVQKNRVTTAGGQPHDDSLIQDYDNPVYEVGGDVTRPLAGGAIKLVGLVTRRKRDNFDAYIGRNGLLEDNPQVVGGFEQTQTAKQGETIGRLTWSRQDLGGFTFEAGGEAVLNTLDNTTELLLINTDGSRRRIDLPVDSAKVKEKRAEVFANMGKSLSPQLRVDAGLTYEFSHLTVTGDASADRRLKFLKPSLSVDWQPGGGWRTKLSVRRTVAQLNFYDFISVAELSADRVNAGNANLQPQRAWEFRATVERPILGDGLLKLDFAHDRISMLQDRILIFDEDGDAFDAPGNLGTGTRSAAEITIDAPLGRIWNGLRVKLNGYVQRSRVEDPISGEKREFSGFFPSWNWSVDVRRDSGPWSYGFVVSDRDRFTFFRTDEFDSSWNGGPYGTAFVEYRPDDRTALTLDVDNAFNTHAFRLRELSSPNRADPEDRIDELRERNRHISVGLTLKRSFGAARPNGGGVANGS